MECKVTPLSHEYLTILGVRDIDLRRAYFSPGSVSYCLLADNKPVFAGGVVNMQWKRGEAWILPTSWFHKHKLVCLRYMARMLPCLAIEGSFKRIQATCIVNISTTLFDWLGFKYEGTLAAFGPNSETCHLYAKVFSK